ncbi:ABC transporter ATP-binding protein [Hyperthermus butylicus]|uniref:ABC-type uncharacterized transporter n=1 Tax=Hyperthermus butylicus (strain DSM 5456 / JCM 9403 / PLM1-5) TaxID=415426 RepID=A2BJ18_HYPBU|nr:ABC transporter ATP-binding protein [Hyperthermus butylicus]ABM79979.1 ABC-type uncharacterized transporter [Hyperthermus butylicus DSM 5456]
METAVRAENLHKVYPGGVHALRGLSFTVFDGEIYGLVGPNGSGKTTTLRILATLLRPTSGKVLIYNIDVLSEPAKVRSLIAYLPEDAGVYRRLKGIEIIELFAKTRFKSSRDREAFIDEAARLSGLSWEELERPAGGYSKGMKRRLLLAITLALRPRLLILDEPTSGLDVMQSMRMRRMILRYNREHNITVLLSSHNMLEVEFLCNRVGIIYGGRLLAEGSPRELKEKFSAENLEQVFEKITGGVNA